MVLDGEHGDFTVPFEAKVRAVAEPCGYLPNVPVYDWLGAQGAEAVERCAMIHHDETHHCTVNCFGSRSTKSRNAQMSSQKSNSSALREK